MHGIIKCQHQGQMSESFPTAAFLSISGGLQDAYTYVFRGKVFANAQTGNIVLLSQNICERNWLQSAHYFVPLAAFAIGIIVAEQIRGKYQNVQNIHWRQIVLLLEMILLFLVSFLPQSLDMLANALVSFSCAMQVQTFRKVNGYAFASTMCIGNMRSGMEALSAYIRTHDRNVLGKALRYWENHFPICCWRWNRRSICCSVRSAYDLVFLPASNWSVFCLDVYQRRNRKKQPKR